jgi:hypothetical protein
MGYRAELPVAARQVSGAGDVAAHGVVAAPIGVDEGRAERMRQESEPAPGRRSVLERGGGDLCYRFVEAFPLAMDHPGRVAAKCTAQAMESERGIVLRPIYPVEQRLTVVGDARHLARADQCRAPR